MPVLPKLQVRIIFASDMFLFATPIKALEHNALLISTLQVIMIFLPDHIKAAQVSLISNFKSIFKITVKTTITVIIKI